MEATNCNGLGCIIGWCINCPDGTTFRKLERSSMECLIGKHTCFYAPCVCACHDSKEIPVVEQRATVRLTMVTCW